MQRPVVSHCLYFINHFIYSCRLFCEECLAETLENYRFYDTEISLEQGLYWYFFRYESEYGEFFVTKCEHCVGHVSPDGSPWQQTVYSKEFTTPDWLKGGIIYQIFPDRFYNSGKKKSDVPADRYIVSDTAKQPEYKQNGEKLSLGNDYYCGDLAGITQKLPYLADLSVSCIYLNPIFVLFTTIQIAMAKITTTIKIMILLPYKELPNGKQELY